jgi:hypothetical protein
VKPRFRNTSREDRRGYQVGRKLGFRASADALPTAVFDREALKIVAAQDLAAS